MQYLIEVLGLEVKDMMVGFRQRWNSTHDTLEDAMAALDWLIADPFACEVVVLEWQAGIGDPNGRCVHANWATRSTLGCAPRQKVVLHRSRPVMHEIWADHRLAGFVWGDWDDVESSVGIEPTTQPGPGFKLKPEKRLGAPVHIQAGLRATCRDPAVPGPVLAFFPSNGWRRFDRVHTLEFG